MNATSDLLFSESGKPTFHSLERLPLPASWKRFVISAASELEEHAREIQQAEAEDARDGEASNRCPRPL